LKQTSILSGFCPASLLKVGTDHDCHASGSLKSKIGTVHPPWPARTDEEAQ